MNIQILDPPAPEPARWHITNMQKIVTRYQDGTPEQVQYAGGYKQQVGTGLALVLKFCILKTDPLKVFTVRYSLARYSTTFVLVKSDIQAALQFERQLLSPDFYTSVGL